MVRHFPQVPILASPCNIPLHTAYSSPLDSLSPIRPQMSKDLSFCSRVIMCYQRANQSWRTSKLLPSLGESRFRQLRTVTWTPRPPANSRPHSTSLQPPPTGMGAGKCISLNLNFHPRAGIKQSHHVFSHS